MVKLKNIKKNHDLISCDFFPEDAQNPGHIEYNIANDEVINCDYPEGYEWCDSHLSHAVDYLSSVANDDKMPESKLIMWY